MWFDLDVSASDDLSREELISLVRTRDARIAERDARIVAQDAQIAELTAANESLAVRLARVEHLLSRNSSNSSSPPSKDDDPGRTPPAAKKKRDTAAGTGSCTPRPARKARGPVRWGTARTCRRGLSI